MILPDCCATYIFLVISYVVSHNKGYKIPYDINLLLYYMRKIQIIKTILFNRFHNITTIASIQKQLQFPIVSNKLLNSITLATRRKMRGVWHKHILLIMNDLQISIKCSRLFTENYFSQDLFHQPHLRNFTQVNCTWDLSVD